LLAACAAMLCGLTKVPDPPLSTILANHVAALASLHAREPHTEETTGSLLGIGISGTFHEWKEGANERNDISYGIRTERTLRLGDRVWVEDANGEIRELQGIVARRLVTEDFIGSESFTSHPESVRYLGRETLPDGRDVYMLQVAPPDGETYQVGIDTKNWLIDSSSYVDHDTTRLTSFSDYRVIDGLLIPFTEVDSDGRHNFDVTSQVINVTVNQPIAADIFTPFTVAAVDTAAPVTVPYLERGGHIFAKVSIEGKSYTFLIDSAAQADVFDTTLVAKLGLQPEGRVEVTGAGQVSSPGIVHAPPISLGGVTFPMRVATVIHLPPFPSTRVDGILGYPFFAAAELRFDPTEDTLTIAQPGALPPDGTRLDVDTDRELPEIVAKIQNASTRVIVDTGDSRELLLFKSFMQEHPGLVSLAQLGPRLNSGIGGSVDAVGAIVNVLQLGPYRLFNRYTDVVLGTTGAFADRNDGGNVGYASLRNFVVTFDLVNHGLFLQPAQGFDDGHDRKIPQ
jgi:hypothetical protein